MPSMAKIYIPFCIKILIHAEGNVNRMTRWKLFEYELVTVLSTPGHVATKKQVQE